AGVDRAGVAVVAVERHAGIAGAGGRVARLAAVADVAVVADDGGSAARPAEADVPGRARVTVVARVRVVHVDAAEDRVAEVVGARVAVVAGDGRAGQTGAVRRIAGLDAVADVVVAAHGRHPDARAAHAGVAGRAGVAVVAGAGRHSVQATERG